MSDNPINNRIAVPYARALFDFSVEKNIMHQITADFQNLDLVLEKTTELTEYLNSPIISQIAKRELLVNTIKPQINSETFKFLLVLIERNRINLLNFIIKNYLQLVYETASIKMIEVRTAHELDDSQKRSLIQKLKELTNAREIRLVMILDPSLIGGFLVKTESKVIDFTIKSQLQKIAKHLDTVLET